MPGSSPFESDPPRFPRRPQFTLSSMLILMALCAVMAALLGGILRSIFSAGTIPVFVLAAVAGPLLAVVVVGAVYQLARLRHWYKNRKE